MKRSLLFSGAGILFLITTGLVYIPKFMNQGLAGIELTFLSNFFTGFLLILDVLSERKKKAIRQELHLASTGILICVMLISIACIGEANFNGPFMFLHVINPLLATVLLITYTYRGKINFTATYLGTLCFSIFYFIYVVLYGWYTDDWLYSIVNIKEKGLLFVICLFLILMFLLTSIEYILHKLSYRAYKKSGC